MVHSNGKVRVAVLFGGQSDEHDVSLRSALTIMGALDPGRYEIVPIGITREGRWLGWEREPDVVAQRIAETLGFPCFTKPADLGSSVGITKIHGPEELVPGMDAAARYDRKLIVEQGVDARELEISVLGNDDPIA